MGKLATLLMVGLAAACLNQISDPSTKDKTFQASMLKWNDAMIQSYDLQMQVECFCGAPTEPVLVTVRNRVIQSRTLTSSGSPVAAVDQRWFPDVPGLFAIVQDALNLPAASLLVAYNVTYGFPIQIDVDYEGGVVDDQHHYAVVGFTIRQ